MLEWGRWEKEDILFEETIMEALAFDATMTHSFMKTDSLSRSDMKWQWIGCNYTAKMAKIWTALVKWKEKVEIVFSGKE